MIRPILKYGDSTLHGEARPVDALTPDVERLIDDMVGRDPNGLIVMINPEFVERDGVQLEEEGCLSVPGFNATVVRPSRAVIKGLDRHGEPQQHEGTALL